MPVKKLSKKKSKIIPQKKKNKTRKQKGGWFGTQSIEQIQKKIDKTNKNIKYYTRQIKHDADRLDQCYDDVCYPKKPEHDFYAYVSHGVSPAYCKSCETYKNKIRQSENEIEESEKRIKEYEIIIKEYESKKKILIEKNNEKERQYIINTSVDDIYNKFRNSKDGNYPVLNYFFEQVKDKDVEVKYKDVKNKNYTSFDKKVIMMYVESLINKLIINELDNDFIRKKIRNIDTNKNNNNNNNNNKKQVKQILKKIKKYYKSDENNNEEFVKSLLKLTKLIISEDNI